MPALWISHVNVSDPEAYAEYAKRAVPVIEAMGGVFIARGAEFRQLEGNAEGNLTDDQIEAGIVDRS